MATLPMATQKDQSVVARHINNAFKEGELEKESNMHFLHNTQYKYRPTMIYSLDVVIREQDGGEGRDGEGGGESD